MLFGKGRPRGQKKCGPVDAVEAADLLADHVDVGGPVFFKSRLVLGSVAAVAESGNVVGERIPPHVDDVLLVAREPEFPN